MIVYNLFNWLAVRDTAYLYYVSFAFFMLLIQSHRHNYQYFFGNFPFFNTLGIYWWIGGAIFCLVNFGRLFLQTSIYLINWINIFITLPIMVWLSL
jgi:hypothetical protein